jgi:hypothetical protein
MASRWSCATPPLTNQAALDAVLRGSGVGNPNAQFTLRPPRTARGR